MRDEKLHNDLDDVIATAKRYRDALFEGEIDVKKANALANHNAGIITAHATKLRERIFVADVASLPAALDRSKQIGSADKAA